MFWKFLAIINFFFFLSAQKTSGEAQENLFSEDWLLWHWQRDGGRGYGNILINLKFDTKVIKRTNNSRFSLPPTGGKEKYNKVHNFFEILQLPNGTAIKLANWI